MDRVKPTVQRRRGVVLTDRGLARLIAAQQQRESRAGAFAIELPARHLRRIVRRERPVDVRTVQVIFAALGLALAARDYRLAASPDLGRSVLPVPRSPFIGRNEILEAVEAQLASAAPVTLVGPGGVGKSRVALETLRRCESRFALVAFVDLSTVADGALVAVPLLDAFGLRGEAAQAPALVADRIGRRPALLCFDNCEHVVADVNRLAHTLMDSAPSLHVMATSREPLGIPGERVVRLGPLDASDAIALFSERAGASDTTFAFDEHDRALIAEIVAQLDAMPLAIELAAARAGTLSLRGVRDALACDVLAATGGPHPSPHARQHSVDESIQWSHRLLDENERLVFRRIAPFQNGFTIAGAAATCALPQAALRNVVERLARKSLVMLIGARGEPRYRLLDAMRVFADRRLTAAMESDATRARHAGFFQVLAAEVGRLENPAERIDGMRRLLAERNDIEAALSWSLAHVDHAPLGVSLASELTVLWEATGSLATAEAPLRKALVLTGSATSNATLARLREALGLALFRQSRLDEATAVANAALDAYVALSDGDGTRRARNLVGMIELEAGAVDAARAAFAFNLADAERAGAKPAESVALNNLGRILAERDGDPSAGLFRFRESLAVARACGHLSMSMIAAGNCAEACAELERFDEAVAYLDEASRLARELDNVSVLCGFALLDATIMIKRSGVPSAYEKLEIARAAVAANPYRAAAALQLDGLTSALAAAGADAAAAHLTLATQRLKRSLGLPGRDAVVQQSAAVLARLSSATRDRILAESRDASLDAAFAAVARDCRTSLRVS